MRGSRLVKRAKGRKGRQEEQLKGGGDTHGKSMIPGFVWPGNKVRRKKDKLNGIVIGYSKETARVYFGSINELIECRFDELEQLW